MRIFQTFVLVNFLWLLIFNSGGITSSDTSARLWMAHHWWNGKSNAAPVSHLEIEIDGKTVIPYDIGQPALMLPADWLGTQISEQISGDPFVQQNIREAIVSYFCFLPVNLACVIAGYWMLRLLDFEARTAALSSTLWLLATTVLQYAVVNQQNNQVLLCLLIGFSSLIAAQKYGRKLYAWLSGMSLGIASLIRISSMAHAFIVAIFSIALPLLAYRQENSKNSVRKIDEGKFRFGQVLRESFYPWLLGLLPGLLFDRWLSEIRFGDWKLTSIAVHWQALQLQAIQQTPEISTEVLAQQAETLSFLKALIPFRLSGILGPLFSLEKSIFIYDILLLPGLLLLVLKWNKISNPFRITVIAAISMFLANLAMYGNFDSWGGDAAWGARYHVTPIHILLLLLIALMTRTVLVLDRRHAKRHFVQCIYACCFSVAIALQVSAISLPYTLEITQQQAETGSAFRLGQRLENMTTLLLPPSAAGSWVASVAEQSPSSSEGYSWSWVPYRYAEKLPQDSPLRNLVPVIFLIWFSLLFLALAMSRRFLKQLKLGAKFGKYHQGEIFLDAHCDDFSSVRRRL